MPILRTEEFFNKRKRMTRDESRIRRFKVYDYIKTHSAEKVTNLDLARAAGFNCDLHSNEREYKRGLGFIDAMIRNGYISFTDYPGAEGRLWYVHGKDAEYDPSLITTRKEPVEVKPVETEEPEDTNETSENTSEPTTETEEVDTTFNCILILTTNTGSKVKVELNKANLKELESKIHSAVDLLR